MSSRLQRAFEEMQGPEQVLLSDGDAGKALYVWRARGPKTSVEEFYDLFDLMALAQAGVADD